MDSVQNTKKFFVLSKMETRVCTGHENHEPLFQVLIFPPIKLQFHFNYL